MLYNSPEAIHRLYVIPQSEANLLDFKQVVDRNQNAPDCDLIGVLLCKK